VITRFILLIDKAVRTYTILVLPSVLQQARPGVSYLPALHVSTYFQQPIQEELSHLPKAT
jgi:hypothetical protein